MVVRAARGLQGSQSGALARYKDCMKGAGCLSRLRGDDHRRMCRAELASPTTALTGDPQRHVGRPNRPGNCEARRVEAKRLMPSWVAALSSSADGKLCGLCDTAPVPFFEAVGQLSTLALTLSHAV
ncbi:hypothetical protein L1887_55963 [Cichorium endivia]|nr:hypothetical protein L1887_55963 [Cichorium endivia]